ncbi:MAG: DUF4339 domain-containing protein [Planctomycetes bacterium]|nr:DUF4339 domain-containing protein [Planctomycetota bacterium]
MPAAEWYYAVGGVRHGPTSAARLRELRRSGRVDDRTLVWREGMPDWVAITDAGELDTGGT